MCLVMARFTLEIPDELDTLLNNEAERLRPVIRSKSALIETVLMNYFGALSPELKAQLRRLINGQPDLPGSRKLAQSQRANA